MRSIVARVLVALLVASALVALRGGSGAHLAAPSREGSPRFPGRGERGEPPRDEPRGEATRHPTPRPSFRKTDVDAPARDTPRRHLCVIAPHRPRANGSSSTSGEPERFAAYLASWLPRAAKVRPENFSVWVVEQADEYRFNRGWLMNVGIALARALTHCDVFALHDVDLLPVDDRLPYGAFPETLVVERDETSGAERYTIKKKIVGAAHLSPPGVHPEYVFRHFKGGAWLFTWRALREVDGYAHVYWGWGLEDDDLGARLRINQNVSVAAKPFPTTRSRDSSGNHDSDARRCTGFARGCAFDPTRRDCHAGVPYETFKKIAYERVPATTREGLKLPEGRTAAEGVCFAHAHEAAFSRDALETETRTFRHSPSRAFSSGRSWEDVKSGRFRVDETTGLKKLVSVSLDRVSDFPKKTSGQTRVEFSGENLAPPEPGHGFAILSLDVVGVEVRRGGARVANVTRYPHEAVSKTLDDPMSNHRWSGNALLERAWKARDENDASFSAPIAHFPSSYPSFVQARVRLTCDEDATPWCVDETRQGSGAAR